MQNCVFLLFIFCLFVYNSIRFNTDYVALNFFYIFIFFCEQLFAYWLDIFAIIMYNVSSKKKLPLFVVPQLCICFFTIWLWMQSISLNCCSLFRFDLSFNLISCKRLLYTLIRNWNINKIIKPLFFGRENANHWKLFLFFWGIFAQTSIFPWLQALTAYQNCCFDFLNIT